MEGNFKNVAWQLKCTRFQLFTKTTPISKILLTKPPEFTMKIEFNFLSECSKQQTDVILLNTKVKFEVLKHPAYGVLMTTFLKCQHTRKACMTLCWEERIKKI